ncbi:hypothetical protein EPO15_14135 [bacterium]|nr:MAG: hypothetical protein EPO15_14135 [bacterium]
MFFQSGSGGGSSGGGLGGVVSSGGGNGVGGGGASCARACDSPNAKNAVSIVVVFIVPPLRRCGGGVSR